MLPRFIPVAKSISSIARQQAVRCMSSAHAPAHFKTDKQIAIEQKTTMNDLPVPEGSWQEQYDKRNAKWNMLLGASSLFLIVTTFATIVSKLVHRIFGYDISTRAHPELHFTSLAVSIFIACLLYQSPSLVNSLVYRPFQT